MGRTRIVAATIVLALAVAAYGGWWLHAAEVLRRGIDQWTEAHRAQGWHVALSDVAITGFPFRLSAVAQRFSVGRDPPVRWRWTGPRLTAAVPPWIGRTVHLSFPGVHKVEYLGATGPESITLDAAQAGGTVQLGADGRVDHLHVRLGASEATAPGFGTAKLAQLDLSVSAPPRSATPAPSDPRAPDVGRLSLSAEGIELPEHVAPTLGPRIGRAGLDIVLRGTVPLAATQAALQAWRDAGGTVDLEKLRLEWGNFQLEAEGTAALDTALQPEGVLTARAWGIGAAIDALVASGGVRPREGATAKVVLHTMAKPATAQGIPPEVELPLTVQEHKLFVGPVPIGHLPTIVWP